MEFVLRKPIKPCWVRCEYQGEGCGGIYKQPGDFPEIRLLALARKNAVGKISLCWRCCAFGKADCDLYNCPWWSTKYKDAVEHSIIRTHT